MLRILVIDDNLADINLLRYGLDCVGEPYHLDVILDGEAALAFIHKHWTERVAFEPCVVVIDLHLPKRDGLSVLESLRKAPAFAHVKRAVITGGASPKEEEKMAEFGVSLYRSKPHTLEEFENLAQELVDICTKHEEEVVAA